MSREFDPKDTEFKIIRVPMVAYTSVKVKVPIDFDLETKESEKYPDFWLYDTVSELVYDHYPNWEILEDESLELQEED